MTFAIRLVCLAATLGAALSAADIDVTDPAHLELRNAQVEAVTYRGRAALKMIEKVTDSGSTYALVKGLGFHDGTIDVDVAGAPAKTADLTVARGFIGVMFRLQGDGSHWECMYLRPTNGRAQDQLQRNHSVQYVSPPEWEWKRLRDETPGQYESYVDMQAGEWTHVRIVVLGKEAELYVGGAGQPCLIVKDLKRGDSEGGLALWIGPGTEGYFRGLTVTKK